MWRRFDKSVRNQIRKAERAGLTVEYGGGDSLAAFYDTLVERMHDLGSPVHGFHFLRQVIEVLGPLARIALVKKDGATVGGLVALAFKDRMVVPWAACRKEYFSLCPNMLLYWETIKQACAEGFARFDFGRSTRQSGTYRFKRQWGAEEEPLYWYRIAIDARRSRSETSMQRRSRVARPDVAAVAAVADAAGRPPASQVPHSMTRTHRIHRRRPDGAQSSRRHRAGPGDPAAIVGVHDRAPDRARRSSRRAARTQAYPVGGRAAGRGPARRRARLHAAGRRTSRRRAPRSRLARTCMSRSRLR